MSKETNSSNYEERMVQPKQGVWRTYDGADGLPAGENCLLQDRQGYLWLGSIHGLCRYDGVNFATYTTEHDLAGNLVSSMCEDHRGRLWIGTFEGGVSCYDNKDKGDSPHFVNYTTENGLAGNGVRSVFEDSQGRLWFGTNNGVSCYEGRGMGDSPHFTNYTTKDGLVSNFINTVCEDPQGRMWFGNGAVTIAQTFHGVSCFDGRGFTNYSTEDGLTGNNVTSICADSRGNVWFATFGSSFREAPGHGGASCYDGERFIKYNTENGLPNNNVVSIHKDKQGRMWFGTFGGGVCCFDGESFTTYTTADGLLDNRVWGIIQDQEGIFWLVHYHSGLTRFDEKTCRLLTETTVTEALIQTDKGSLWYGNANRLYCLSNSRQRCVEFTGIIYSMIEDSNGHLWIGTAYGLYRYDSADDVWEGRFKQFAAEDGLNSQTIYSLMEAKDGTIWAGTIGSPGCLCRYDKEQFTAIKTGHPVVQRLLEDNSGRIWVGGFAAGGLTYYKSGKLQNYTIPPGGLNSVISIIEDNDNRLWIGTLRDLYCFDGGNFVPYGERISGHSMHQISAKDAKGHLWFGTNGDGIYRYDGRHFQQLTRADGLPSDTVTGLVPQPDGSMIIGTSKGIAHYHSTATMPPKIQIGEVVADQVYPDPDELELTTTQASLVTIGYHGMSFSTNRIRYSYILEGFDEEWEDTWEHQVRYEKLPAGEYTFKVIAINRDLVASESPAVLIIKVVPDPRDEQIAQLESELLERERAEMERIHKELEEARQIQLSLLPENPPEIEGFQIAGISSPAREVSGDFYSYLSLEKSIGIALGDVTGKSVRAAMVATMTDGMLHRGMGNVAHSPAEIFRGLNVDLQPRLTHTMFVAMVLGIIRPEEKRLILANAGMPHPIMKSGSEVRELEISALPLGITEKSEYSEINVDLNDGDFVIFYSDGVIEAENEAGGMYQTEKLLDLIRQADPGLSAQEMVGLILADVAGYVGSREAYDDITIVIIKYEELSC